MNIPDFLETDFNNLRRTNNAFQKFHKLIHFNLMLLKYLVIVLYHSSKLTEFKNNKVSKKIYTNFTTPTEGAWLDLLELLLSNNFMGLENPNKIFNKNLNSELVHKFTQVYTLTIHNSIEHNHSLSIREYFKRIVSIKNKLVSHGIITEDNSVKFIDVITPLLEEVIESVNIILNIPLVLIEENELEADFYCESVVGDWNTKEIKDNPEQFIENGLYYILSTNIIYTWPFLICRDGNVLIYNKFDNKNKKILYIGQNNKEQYVKAPSDDISEIFNLDKDALNIKSIPIQIKDSPNGIRHNLPDTDYKEFIGRKNELYQLEMMVLHKRHFISALDGIGGVGKSAIALELCNKILKSNPKDEIYFEFIIWLSAKTTILKNGEIHYIKQAFEHLEQLLDTILDICSFSEYKDYENNAKSRIVLSILNSKTKSLIVLDNLETIKKDNLSAIWDFINNIPEPSKVLLTSREFHYDVPQTLRIENLSNEDSRLFIIEHCSSLGMDNLKIEEIIPQIIQIASGLPIALKSIIGQLYLGKNFRAIKNAIEQNTDDLSKFCFKEQLRLLKTEHMSILTLICLATEELDYDSLSFMLEPILINSNLLQLINELVSLSIIKVNQTTEGEVYTILPLIKSYILSTYKNEELNIQLKEKLSEYYQLKESDTYTLLPIEERTIDKGSLLPRKIVDIAMKHSHAGEFEEAENYFRKALKNYSSESYVWYMYAIYLAQYPSKLSDAINALKKADDLSSNYIYNKKIGDFHLKLKNYQAAIKNYRIAMQKATIDKNKDEMLYLIGYAEFSRAKHLRQLIKRKDENVTIEERNEAYKNCIENFVKYIDTQPSIYDGKLINIYRMLSESYFGLKNKEVAIKFIDLAIELSESDEIHIEFKRVIENRKNKFESRLNLPSVEG
jgi:tetratricopeptide (TPR) repeat protein